MSIKWGAEKCWNALLPEIMAIAKNENGGCWGYEQVVTEGPTLWYPKDSSRLLHDLNAIDFTNIPDDWRESLVLRPVERGSKAYWDEAPDWAVGSAVNENGVEVWCDRKPVLAQDGFWWTTSDGRIEDTGHCQNATDWQNSWLPRPHVWRVPDEDTPVDAKVWVRYALAYSWNPRHYAGRGRCWLNGMTSFAANSREWSVWAHIVLANPSDPDQAPPLDWKPGGEG